MFQQTYGQLISNTLLARKYQDTRWFIEMKTFSSLAARPDVLMDQTRISKFSQRGKNWIQVGNLNVKRRGHAAIFDGVELVVIGGNEAHSIEHCTQSNGIFDCLITEQARAYDFTNYVFYPELAIIDEEFCGT